LDAELTHKAHEMGLIISKTCENALKQAINRLQGLNTSYIPQNPSDGQNKGMVDGRDLNLHIIYPTNYPEQMNQSYLLCRVGNSFIIVHAPHYQR
jgi:hypothetical protein